MSTASTAPPAEDKSANGTLAKIERTIGDLLHLQVITAVGDIELDEDQGNITNESLKGTRKMFTRIGLLDGDITTAMSDDFVTNEAYAGLRTFHQDTVAQGNQIVSNNIKALKELVVLLKNELGAKLDKTP